MRRAARTDANHAEVVKVLRAGGCSVQSLAAVGDGCPDALVGRRGRNYLVEIKDGTKPPSARKLTPDQVKWHADWRGDVVVLDSVGAALQWMAGAP